MKISLCLKWDNNDARIQSACAGKGNRPESSLSRRLANWYLTSRSLQIPGGTYARYNAGLGDFLMMLIFQTCFSAMRIGWQRINENQNRTEPVAYCVLLSVLLLSIFFLRQCQRTFYISHDLCEGFECMARHNRPRSLIARLFSGRAVASRCLLEPSIQHDD